MATVPTPVRLLMRLTEAVSPLLAARLLERLFFTPPRSSVGAADRRFVRSGRRLVLRADGRRVAVRQWGRGPVVILVHGWGSRSGRLRPLAEPLLAAGYGVVAFDAPGHGESGRGMSSLPEFARALCAVVERLGPAYAVVAHSLGGAATVLAAARLGLDARRFALLAPPANPASWLTALTDHVGVGAATLHRFRTRTERRLRFQWHDLDIRAMARELDRPALVVHDWDDRVVPWTEGAAIADAWPGARLHTTRGLGHRGVVRDPAVVAEVARFVMGRHARPGTPAPGDGEARLEYELFHPDARRRE